MAAPVVLLILDGWGLTSKNKGNAIEIAHKPNFDRLWDEYPHTELQAHGKYVGLPSDQVGNSEAGHMNIGAGRIIKQDSVLISEAIADGRFQKNLALNETMQATIDKKSDLHLMGLISENESPHSSLDHLYALVDLAYIRGVKKVYLHLFTDGRDSRQFATINIIDQITARVDGQAQLATLIGRYYAMDRGKTWDRTEKAYRCLVGDSEFVFKTPQDALLHAYNQQKTDEYIEPSIIAFDKKSAKDSRIKSNDAVIFFNLRSDRARQMTKPFVQKEFNRLNIGAFDRGPEIKNLSFCTLTDFGPDLDHIPSAFPSADIRDTLPMMLKDRKQIYIAETEKYAHMTYFINGGYADKVGGEDRVHIRSKRVRSYADAPEMRVNELTTMVKLILVQRKYDFIAINFANPDMVGHTGNLKSTVKAIEAVDKCLGVLVKSVLKKDGIMVVTADHGNAEKMIDLDSNEVWGGHTTNPVPFIIISHKKIGRLRKGILGDIAPTIYDLLGLRNLPKGLNNSLIEQ